MKYDVITIGSATRDVYIESSKIISIHSDKFQTQKALCVGLGSKIEVDNLIFTTGGSAVNTAITFSQQGIRAAVFAKIGRDSRGQSLKNRLKKMGVSCDLIIEDDKELTAYSVIIHAPTGERSIFVYRGATSHLSRDSVNFDIFKQAKWIFMTHLAEDSSKLFAPILEYASSNNIKIALNPGSTQLEIGSKLIPFLKKVDILFINQEEASLLTGINFEKEDEIFKKFDEWMTGLAVMTKGPKGVTISDGKTRWDAPILSEPKFVDRTGAGDAFASGFTTAIIKGQSIEEAIQLGSANATGVIGEWGANRGLLSPSDSVYKFGKLKIKKVTL